MVICVRGKAARYMTNPRSFVPLVFVVILAGHAAPAAAQYGPPPWAYSEGRDDYPPPPGPPGYGNPWDNGTGYEQPQPQGLTIAAIRRRVAHMGLHLLAKPRRKDNIFLAEAEAPGGVGHRLVFDADSGELIENTALPARKKHVAPDTPVPPAPVGQ
jgi:hypothetical protein